MKIRTKIYLGLLVFSLILALFLGMIYFNYQKQYQHSLKQYATKVSEAKKDQVLRSLNLLSLMTHNHKETYTRIHTKAQQLCKKFPDYSMNKIKELLATQYNAEHLKIELYLVDPKLIIVDTTYPRDLGFNLGAIPHTKEYVKKLDNTNIVFVEQLANDELDNAYKQYSFAQLDNGYLLEMAFIDKKLNENIKVTYASSEYTFYVVITIDDHQVYYKTDNDFKAINKQNMFDSLPKFYNDQATDDPVIQASRDKKPIFKQKEDVMLVTSPVLDRTELQKGDNHFSIIQLAIDISAQEKFHTNFLQLFGFIVTFIIIFIIFVFQWIQNNLTKTTDTIANTMRQSKTISNEKLLNKPDEFGMIARTYNELHHSLTNELKINRTLLAENKRFIADTVHQIRTPLSVIMMNSEMIQLSSSNKDTDMFIDQINASINMLTNSYEDLSYVISHDQIEYKPQTINLSDLLKDRITFFTTIAKVNEKSISYDIDPEIMVSFNLIEAERLIDNNISNAVKYASLHKPIHITLKRYNSGYRLSFASYGEPLKESHRLFEKNYRQHEEKRGLGLGLNMVKGICIKYGITFDVTYKDEQNIFIYTLEI